MFGRGEDAGLAGRAHHTIGANLRRYKMDFPTHDHGPAGGNIASTTPVRVMYIMPTSLVVGLVRRLGVGIGAGLGVTGGSMSRQ